MKKQHLRIQEGHFLKSALNRDLTLPPPLHTKLQVQGCHFLKAVLNLDLTLSNARSRQGDAARIFFMVVGAFCVELRPFYCNERISVPMSYN